MKNSASATATATLVTYADADGIDYNYEYDLVAPTVIPYFGFDLTPCHGIVPDHLCVPTGTYVVSTNAAEPITRHGCRVAGASLASTSAGLFVHDAHGPCWGVEVMRSFGGGLQRVSYVTLDALGGQPYAVKVIR